MLRSHTELPDARQTVTDIRSWYGFVNQLAVFLATAPIMNSFRELLKKPMEKALGRAAA